MSYHRLRLTNVTRKPAPHPTSRRTPLSGPLAAGKGSTMLHRTPPSLGAHTHAPRGGRTQHFRSSPATTDFGCSRSRAQSALILPPDTETSPASPCLPCLRGEEKAFRNTECRVQDDRTVNAVRHAPPGRSSLLILRPRTQGRRARTWCDRTGVPLTPVRCWLRARPGLRAASPPEAAPLTQF